MTRLRPIPRALPMDYEEDLAMLLHSHRALPQQVKQIALLEDEFAILQCYLQLRIPKTELLKLEKNS